MLSILLPTAVLTAAAVMSLFAVFASKVGVFAPVAEPQLVPGASDPSTDTLAGSSEMVKTVLIPPRKPEWQTATLHSMADVEDLLDSLEAHGVASREVSVVNNNTFAVRWKK